MSKKPSAATSNTVTVVVAIIAAVATISAAVIAAIVASRANSQAAQANLQVAQVKQRVSDIQQRFNEMKTLAQSSHDAIPSIIKGSQSATLELSNLYFLAQTVADKREVIQLVAFAHNSDLYSTLKEILEGDPVGKEIASKDPYIVALIHRHAPPTSVRKNGADHLPSSKNAETTLLQLATLPASVGWSYLGEGSTNSRRLLDPSLRSNVVPSPGDAVTFVRDVYLRSGPPDRGDKLTQAIGIISAGQTAQLSQVQPVDLGGGRRTFWGRLSLVVRGHGETDTPVLISPESVKFYSVSDAKDTSIVVRNIGKTPVHVSIAACLKGRACTFSDATVPPVNDANDSRNDYYDTIRGVVDPHPLFDWKVWV